MVQYVSWPSCWILVSVHMNLTSQKLCRCCLPSSRLCGCCQHLWGKSQWLTVLWPRQLVHAGWLGYCWHYLHAGWASKGSQSGGHRQAVWAHLVQGMEDRHLLGCWGLPKPPSMTVVCLGLQLARGLLLALAHFQPLCVAWHADPRSRWAIFDCLCLRQGWASL